VATILRTWSYQYPWLYDTISRVAALSVGGDARFRQLALEGLPFSEQSKVLDVCCGGGQVTRWLVERSPQVVGLDASPRSLERAKQQVPRATFIQAWAEQMPFADGEFDIVHTSAALHEMQPSQLRQILGEVYRVLKPGGWFTLVDFHSPTNPIFWPGLAIFLWLFETETSWQLLQTDLLACLAEVGFPVTADQARQRFFAGGSLQVIQVQKC
jgi:demethylmenaquinone methyltransferase/2-methoxy-6-polyprenyl-1,4-benzoquinol methylase